MLSRFEGLEGGRKAVKLTGAEIGRIGERIHVDYHMVC